MPIAPAEPGPSTRYWSTYQLAFLAILAFALVAVAAGVVFDVIEAPPPDEGTSAPADSSDDGGEQASSDRGRVLVTLPPELDEASGIAVNAESGVVWAHNDDPGSAILFALDLEGRLLRAFEVSGVRVADLEDVARAPCPGERDRSCLYLADTGDNNRSRTASQIVALAEPSTADAEIEVVGSAIFTYEDGRGRDVESLAVSGERVLRVSKGQDGAAEVFELGLEALAPVEARSSGESAAGSPAIARRVATLSIDVSQDTNRPTGAAISPDGESLAVRTAQTVYRFRLDDLEAAPVTCSIGFEEPQGEAIDFLDDERVLLTGEMGSGPNPAPLIELECPSSTDPA